MLLTQELDGAFISVVFVTILLGENEYSYMYVWGGPVWLGLCRNKTCACPISTAELTPHVISVGDYGVLIQRN